MNQERTIQQLIAENHETLFSLNAASVGGLVQREDSITYTITPPVDASICFPSSTVSTPGQLFDKIVEDFRRHNCTNIGCWSLDPPGMPDLDAYLLSRGFQPGWNPCWMYFDTQEEHQYVYEVNDVNIVSGEYFDVSQIKNLPYHEGGTFSESLKLAHPEKIEQVYAIMDGKVVGQTMVLYTEVAGVYNVGVIPSMQRKGIATAMVLKACALAKEKGVRFVTLNANDLGRPVYERAGFLHAGKGKTWWITGRNYIDKPDSSQQIAIAEAIGTGNILKLVSGELGRVDPTTTLANGMSLVQLAVECRKPESVEWLVASGADYSALDAWDLGWKERAEKMLANPREKARLYFSWKGSLIHVAAQRGDEELAALALKAGVDPEIRDSDHDSTALGWAEFFGRAGIIRMIRLQIAGRTPEL